MTGGTLDICLYQMQSGSRLIPMSLPPRVVTATGYTTPDQCVILPVPSSDPDKPFEPPATVYTGFDQIYSELSRSFKEDEHIIGSKTTRRHTDENIKNFRPRQGVNKPDPTKSAPKTGAFSSTAMVFEERRNMRYRSRFPSSREPYIPSHTPSSPQPRIPARELFPPIELNFGRNRKKEEKPTQSTNDMQVQFDRMSIGDKQVNADESAPREQMLEGNIVTGLRLEKRSYEEPVADTYEEVSHQQIVIERLDKSDKLTNDLCFSIDALELLAKKHLTSSRHEISLGYMQLTWLSLVLLLVLVLDFLVSRVVSRD